MRQLKSRKGVECFPCVGDPAEGKRKSWRLKEGWARRICFADASQS